ncbi:DUF3098 domain-containing protein [Oscillatoria amoena NRMC-F 0135]|nr:DUF3098 domain-containing protein [Oscillatoria amoena NRMC-F 0135]
MEHKLPFTRKNYLLMIVGLVTLAVGFVTMALDSEPHGFGFVGLTLGPTIVVIGFIIEIIAILYKPRNKG